MSADIDSIQEKVKALGSVSRSTDFLEGFLRAFDFPAATIERLKSTRNYNVNDGVTVGRQLYFLSSEGSNLYSDLNILKWNGMSAFNVRFIIISNSNEILAFDLKIKETLLSAKEELYKHVDFFFPLIGKEKPEIEANVAVNIQVSEKFAQLYNECRLDNNKISIEDINELICRLLFCCVINGMGLLMNGNDSLFIFAQKFSDESGSDFSIFLHRLFGAIHQKDRSNLPIQFRQVNYIDSRLFLNDLSHIQFTKSTRSLALEIIALNWSKVDPEILGALIQAIVTPSDENITGNFTATSNIQKVIRPLFLDKLYEEFEHAKGNDRALVNLIDRIRHIHIFDVSCGSGNFLLVSYYELNLLLKKVSNACGFKSVPAMPAENFYGIESKRFSCDIARMGLLFVVMQCGKPTLESLLSNIGILFSSNIVNANPLRISWEFICPGNTETYILGNPSYRGARRRTPKQTSDMEFVFKGCSDYKNLDYASCWFFLATKYIHLHGGAFAFVTTNSLTQGEQVSLLWPKLYEYDVHIKFGHKAFKWRNDARNTTAVTVVIVGVATNADTERCRLYAETNMTEPPHISPYLTPGSTIVHKSKHPISALPMMVKGDMPYDGGYLLMNQNEKERMVQTDPRVGRYLRKIVGSKEFINGIERWCLWIPDKEAEDALKIPAISERVSKVRELRLQKSDSNARKLAEYPYRFREMRETHKNSLVIPSVSSENREYIPVGFITSKTIVSNLAFVIYDCDPWIFGVVSSKMHSIWIKAVCGGLETRIRYSNELGYNTFPFPPVSEDQRNEIKRLSYEVIAAREKEPDMTYADMYKKDSMSDDLRFAHHMLDIQIEKCYRDEPFVNDGERLDCLFELYERIIKNDG